MTVTHAHVVRAEDKVVAAAVVAHKAVVVAAPVVAAVVAPSAADSPHMSCMSGRTCTQYIPAWDSELQFLAEHHPGSLGHFLVAAA